MLWICASSSVGQKGRGAEGVSFNNDLFGDFSNVRYRVRNVTLENEVFCGGVYGFAEQEVTHAAGGR